MAISDWASEARGPKGALQEKLNALIKQSFAQTKTFSSGEGKRLLAKAHVVLTPGAQVFRIYRKRTVRTSGC